jgi:hypothetical protein
VRVQVGPCFLLLLFYRIGVGLIIRLIIGHIIGRIIGRIIRLGFPVRFVGWAVSAAGRLGDSTGRRHGQWDTSSNEFSVNEWIAHQFDHGAIEVRQDAARTALLQTGDFTAHAPPQAGDTVDGVQAITRHVGGAVGAGLAIPERPQVFKEHGIVNTMRGFLHDHVSLS